MRDQPKPSEIGRCLTHLGLFKVVFLVRNCLPNSRQSTGIPETRAIRLQCKSPDKKVQFRPLGDVATRHPPSQAVHASRDMFEQGRAHFGSMLTQAPFHGQLEDESTLLGGEPWLVSARRRGPWNGRGSVAFQEETYTSACGVVVRSSSIPKVVLEGTMASGVEVGGWQEDAKRHWRLTRADKGPAARAGCPNAADVHGL